MADEHEQTSEPIRAANQSLAPKRRQTPIEKSTLQPPPNLDDPVSYLSSRLDHLAERLGMEGSPPAEGPAPAPIRERRFSRSGTINGDEGLNELLKGGKPASVSAVPLNAGVETAQAAGPETRTTGRVAAPRLPGISVASYRKRMKVFLIGAQLFGLSMLVAGFVGGWLFFSNSAAPTADAGSAAGVPGKRNTDNQGPMTAGDYALRALEPAMKAEHDGNYDDARRLYEEMLKQDMVLPGLSYRLAILAVRRGDPTEGDLRVLRSIHDGEAVLGSYYVRATFAGVKGDYTNATRSFDSAAHAEPFDPRPFFYWAECLRRDGKPLAAVTRLDQALNRPLLPADAEYVRFKRDLASVEAGDAEFLAALATKLRQPNPSGATLLVAAANDITQSAFPAAAEHLQAAAQAMPPAEFGQKIADYLFQAQKERPALAALLAKKADRPTSDPAAWGIMEADPGTWPPPTIMYAH